MNPQPTLISSKRIRLAFILLFASPLAAADLLGDLNQAVDLIKKVGNITPDKESPSATPPSGSAIQTAPQSGKLSTQQDAKFIFSHPERYFERAPLLNTLGFNIGEVIVIQSPYKDTFRNLHVPSYKGIPRLGLTPSYPQLVGTSDRWKQQAVKTFLQTDMAIYHNLRFLTVMEKQASEVNLKLDQSTGENLDNLKGESYHQGLYSIQGVTRPNIPAELALRELRYKYIPRWHIESLAIATLQPKAYKQYFCDSDTCNDGNYFLRVVGNWGGFHQNNNNIKERKAYFNFVETEVPKLKLWAQSLNREVYLTGSFALPKYNFKRQGYEISLAQPNADHIGSFTYAPRGKSNRVFHFANEKTHTFFFAINAAKAEALQLQLQTTPNGAYNQLYYAIKGEIYNAGPATHMGFKKHNTTSLGASIAYDTTGSVIEFFSDELLTNKLFEASIK